MFDIYNKMSTIKYTKELLTYLVKKNNNINGVLKELNIIPGSNNERIWRYIKKYNIDYSHFNQLPQKRENYGKPLKELLVINSTVSRGTLKKRLFKEGLKINKCEICNQGEEWNGNKMSLILDHINGINNDNRLENLRIICPNCNACTLTFCRGSNNSKKRKHHVDRIVNKMNKNKQKIEEYKNKIMCLNIDYSKKTWGAQISKHLNISPARCLSIVKLYLPHLIPK